MAGVGSSTGFQHGGDCTQRCKWVQQAGRSMQTGAALLPGVSQGPFRGSHFRGRITIPWRSRFALLSRLDHRVKLVTFAKHLFIAATLAVPFWETAQQTAWHKRAALDSVFIDETAININMVPSQRTLPVWRATDQPCSARRMEDDQLRG